MLQNPIILRKLTIILYKKNNNNKIETSLKTEEECGSIHSRSPISQSYSKGYSIVLIPGSTRLSIPIKMIPRKSLPYISSGACHLNLFKPTVVWLIARTCFFLSFFFLYKWLNDVR